MPEYRIAPDPDGVTIELKGVAGRQAELAHAFAECQAGQCTCPTDEYKKLDAMEIAATTDGITLKLRAKTDAEFDAVEISACLDHTIAKATES